MKRFFITLGLFLGSSVLANWGDDTRLTYTTNGIGLSLNNARTVAAKDASIHTVWYEKSAPEEIYYKRSLDGGDNWQSAVRLTNDNDRSVYPAVAVDDFGGVHVVWCNTMGTHEKIWYIHSLDDGQTWDTIQTISDLSKTSNFPRYPTIACRDSTVWVFWNDDRTGTDEIYFRKSVDKGKSWTQDSCLTQVDNMASMYPSVVIDDSENIHLVWREQKVTKFAIYYKRLGSPEVELSPDSAGIPCLAYGNGQIHVVWDDNRGQKEIYYRRSVNRGITWDSITRMTFHDGLSFYPTIACDTGDGVYLVWADEYNNSWYDLYYRFSGNGGRTWNSEERLTFADGYSSGPCLAFSQRRLHLAWGDNRNGNKEVYYKRQMINIAIEENTEHSKELRVFPNPFCQSVKIDGTNQVQVEIFDLSGRLVGKTKEGIWDSKRMPPGVYFLKVKNSEPVKIIKIR